MKLTLTGRQGHASRPQLANNTLRACAHVIVALEALREEFPRQNPLFKPPESTFEPTRKDANVPNINTIPGILGGKGRVPGTILRAQGKCVKGMAEDGREAGERPGSTRCHH